MVHRRWGLIWSGKSLTGSNSVEVEWARQVTARGSKKIIYIAYDSCMLGAMVLWLCFMFAVSVFVFWWSLLFFLCFGGVGGVSFALLLLITISSVCMIHDCISFALAYINKSAVFQKIYIYFGIDHYWWKKESECCILIKSIFYLFVVSPNSTDELCVLKI